MINKTRGLVLSHIPYGESSIIARLYTEHFGCQSFIVNSVRSKKSRSSMAYFQPLNCLDMVIYWKPTRDIQRIAEYKPQLVWHDADIRKQTVLLFLSEVLDKLLRNEHADNPELFQFLLSALSHFRESEKTENFHLHFLLKLSSYLGIAILSGEELFENMNRVVDRSDIERLVNELLQADFGASIEANGLLRLHSLEYLMHYFHHHVPGFGEVRSLKVLAQIFR